MSKPAEEVPGIIAAELLCSSVPKLDRASVLSALRVWLPEAEPLSKDDKSSLLAFAHPKHVIAYKEGSIPAQTLVVVADKPPKAEFFQESIQQSWWFPEARSVASSCRATVLISDLMARGLEYRQRLELFQRALLAVLSIVKCDGVHMQASRQILHPSRILDDLTRNPPPTYTAGAINVRMFKIENAGENEMVMDSMGLAVLGLPDVQCHFKSLDANAVARVLYNTAAYLFEQGDVVQDGQTVEGVQQGSKWRCQHEAALVPPARLVLDIDPGQPFAAGQRRNV